MLRRTLSALLIVTAVLVVRPALAADNPLEAFPSNTSLIVRFKKPQATIEKVASLVDAVAPGQGAMVRISSAGLGAVIANQTQEGVDRNADWWLGVFVSPESEPALVYAIPAKDAKAMEEALGADVTFIKYEKWGIYCDKEDAAARIKTQIKDKGDSINDVMDKHATAVMDQAELSVFINVGELMEAYETQLEAAKGQLEAALEGGAAPGVGAPGVDSQAVFSFMGQFLGALLQGLEDTESCTLGLAVSKQGIGLEQYAAVTADSATGKWLKANGGTDMKSLASLPPSLIYYGLHGSPSTLMSASLGMMKSLVKDDEDAQKALEGLQKDYADLEIGTMTGSVSLGTPSQGAMRVVSITELKDPKKMRELAKKMAKIMGEIELDGVDQTYDFKPDAEKAGKHSVDVLTVTQKFDEDNPQAESQEKMLTLLYGPEGMVTRFVYLKDRVVQTIGGGKLAMAKALQTVEGGASAASGPQPFDATRKKLGDKLNGVVLIDLPSFLAGALKVAVENNPDSLPIPVDAGKLGQVTPAKPSFLGMAFTLEPAAIRSRIVLPVEQLQGLAKFAALTGGQGAGGALQPPRPNRN